MTSSPLSFSLPPLYSSFLPRFSKLASVSIFSNMMVPLAGICDTAFLGHLADIRHLADDIDTVCDLIEENEDRILGIFFLPSSSQI